MFLEMYYMKQKVCCKCNTHKHRSDYSFIFVGLVIGYYTCRYSHLLYWGKLSSTTGISRCYIKFQCYEPLYNSINMFTGLNITNNVQFIRRFQGSFCFFHAKSWWFWLILSILTQHHNFSLLTIHSSEDDYIFSK